mmetsp:Transcript_122421/g.273355  ORF Transcript_122421/g.273355 Transcript_122421/m.273355 type:complete len:138 (-) Transcript_122421:96-509(-)
MSLLNLLSRFQVPLLIFVGRWRGIQSYSTVPENCYTPPGECVFPFTYLGVNYTDCTNVDSAGQGMWCGTWTTVTDDWDSYEYCKRCVSSLQMNTAAILMLVFLGLIILLVVVMCAIAGRILYMEHRFTDWPSDPGYD